MLPLAAVAVVAGCQSIGDPGALTSESLLKAANTSPDAATLDIYWARTALDDSKFADRLWHDVQEDRIPVEVRCALAADGLRAGVVGGTPSDEIMRLLNPSGADLDEVDESPMALTTTPAQVTRRMRNCGPALGWKSKPPTCPAPCQSCRIVRKAWLAERSPRHRESTQ